MYIKKNTSFFPRGYSTSSSSRTQKGQNVNNKKRTTANLTDTPVKNALKKNYNTRLGATGGKKTGPKMIGKKRVCNIYSERYIETPKNIKKLKNASDTKKKALKVLYACIVLTHILEVRPQKCRFSAYNASCGHTKNALITVSLLFAETASQKGSECFRLKNECCWLYVAASLC